MCYHRPDAQGEVSGEAVKAPIFDPHAVKPLDSIPTPASTVVAASTPPPSSFVQAPPRFAPATFIPRGIGSAANVTPTPPKVGEHTTTGTT